MSTPMRPSAKLLRIGALKPRELEALMLRGGTPDRDALPGREYIGLNLGPAARLLGIRKFIKGFYSPAGGQTFGYNVRARQNRPVEPWAAKLSDGKAKRFGFYLVLPVDPESRDNAYLHALLLDYGLGGNGRFDITSLLRDYVVRVKPDSDDLLLGKAFFAIGKWRLPAGYFVLERCRPSSDAKDR